MHPGPLRRGSGPASRYPWLSPCRRPSALCSERPRAMKLRNMLPDAFSSGAWQRSLAGLSTVVPLVENGELQGSGTDQALPKMTHRHFAPFRGALLQRRFVFLLDGSLHQNWPVSLVADSYSRVGFAGPYCSTPRSTLMADGFSFYVTVFYLSKCAPCPAPPCKCQLTQPCAAMLQTGSLLTRSS